MTAASHNTPRQTVPFGPPVQVPTSARASAWIRTRAPTKDFFTSTTCVVSTHSQAARQTGMHLCHSRPLLCHFPRKVTHPAGMQCICVILARGLLGRAAAARATAQHTHPHQRSHEEDKAVPVICARERCCCVSKGIPLLLHHNMAKHLVPAGLCQHRVQQRQVPGLKQVQGFDRACGCGWVLVWVLRVSRVRHSCVC